MFTTSTRYIVYTACIIFCPYEHTLYSSVQDIVCTVHFSLEYCVYFVEYCVDFGEFCVDVVGYCVDVVGYYVGSVGYCVDCVGYCVHTAQCTL